METKDVMMLPPEALLANNIRYGLKKYRVDALAEAITAIGRVHTPLAVEKLEEPGPKGEKYGVLDGHYRQAAVAKLNKDGAGLLLPCVLETPADMLDRRKRQLSGNVDRENMSAMDMAVVIKDLLDLGMPKVEIRQLFSRPGGRKGMAMQPISNAMLNIYLSFLDFPKAIQAKIHDGILPVQSAYKLTTKPKEDWQKILDAAEADRQSEITADEKAEERFLDAERKAAEQEAKSKQDAEALIAATKIAADKEAEAKAKSDKAAEAYKLATAAKAKDAKAHATEKFKAAEADAKAAQKLADDAVKEAAKLQSKVDANTKLAAERKAKLDEARKAVAGKHVRAGDIDKAAAKVAGSGPVPLTAQEIRKGIADLTLPGSFPKVQRIGQTLAKYIAGAITDNQLLSELAFIVGERKQRPTTLKEDVPVVPAA